MKPILIVIGIGASALTVLQASPALLTIFPLPLPIVLYKWLFFACLTGMLLNVLLRADYAQRSGVNTYPTKWSFVKRNWVTILVRIFPWGLGAFYLWTLKPDLGSTIAKYFGVPDWLANWATLPVNIATALGFGFVIDILLDKAQSWAASVTDNKYLSWLNAILQGRLPEYDSAVVKVERLTSERKVGEE